MSRDKKARLALIGCGRIARQGHLPYLKENKHAAVVAAVDLNEKNRKALCRKFDIPADYATPDEMFEREKPDGVLICTPNWVHRELTLLAASRGVHVFCEKPMAVNADEAGDMVRACEEAGVRLQMGMVKRFDAGMVRARRMVQSGRLGRVSQIYTSCLTPPPPDMDGPLFQTAKKWAAALNVDIEEKLGLWRMHDERTGGGQLLEMGTHLLDMILSFAGETPVQWSGFTNSNRDDFRWEDQGTLIMKFPSGIIGTTEMNMCATSDNMIGEKGVIYGDRASLHFNFTNGMWFGLPFYHYITTQLKLFGALSPLTGVGLPVPVQAGKNRYMHKLQMDYFVDSILGRDTDYFGFGPDFAATGRDGLAVMRVIDSAYKSGENQQGESF